MKRKTSNWKSMAGKPALCWLLEDVFDECDHWMDSDGSLWWVDYDEDLGVAFTWCEE